MNLMSYRNGPVFKRLFRKTEPLLKEKREALGRKINLMEVCGTHTVAFSKSGVRNLLAPYINLVSGLGCPASVTDQCDIDQMIAYATCENVIVTTFANMLKVPGTHSNLYQRKLEGSDIRIVQSPSQSLEIAEENPDKRVVFLGIGFETTAPSIAQTIKKAKEQGTKNYFVYPANKLTLPAVASLLMDKEHKLDGLLLPGHVSVIIGRHGWQGLERFRVPTVISGFEPIDLLSSVVLLLKEMDRSSHVIQNNYPRHVREFGNGQAKKLVEEVFEVHSPSWRGFGKLPDSGLTIQAEFKKYDVRKNIVTDKPMSRNVKDCRCGDIVKAKEVPFNCKLFDIACTPESPLGPCMVSSEGICSTYYQYEREHL
ncbi:hydrogenase formation protein HypD [Thalassobacillus sp. B23F22_16]|uniref:hydrogenase formation protein HypD n=1 Tax=Thalassobacillus sp. B23F22_16 TaxID=3459513 RepID=UPI003748EF80